MPARQSSDLLRGTLEVLVLRALSWGPRHGYAIARWLESRSDDEFPVEDGSLYPALFRMEERGWIAATWGETDSGREARFYRLTAKGRAELKRQTTRWAAFSSAISRILLTAP